MFGNVDGQTMDGRWMTDAGVIGILIAHLGAVGSGELKIKSKGSLASSLSTYDFSTFYTRLPNSLMKEKLTELIEQTFKREASLYLACNENSAFFYFCIT